MNKKTTFAILAVFNLVAISVLTAIPVHATITYHGSTTVWERGGKYNYPPSTSDANYSTVTTAMYASVWPGDANVYLNSELVDAASGTWSTIIVRIWWVNDTLIEQAEGDGSGQWECKLYKNGVWQDTKTANPALRGYNYQEFEFTGLSVSGGNDLDIDSKFIVSADTGEASGVIDYTYVSFYSP